MRVLSCVLCGISTIGIMINKIRNQNNIYLSIISEFQQEKQKKTKK